MVGDALVPLPEALQKGYKPCLDFALLCRVYGCRPEELSVLEGERQNLIYYKDWNIAYESKTGGGRCLAYYGNPFYDYFGSHVAQVQWTSEEPHWKQHERKFGEYTPEEQVLILNALTEIMHWREQPGHAKILKDVSREVFEGPDAERFQHFLKERERKLVLTGKW